MKKGIALLLSLLLLLPLFGAGKTAEALYTSKAGEESEAIWYVNYYVDVFGDPTDEMYLTNLAFEGTFNNSAATKAELKARLLVDEDSVCIVLYEYGSYRVKNGSEWSNVIYDIKVKTVDGSKVDITGTNYCGGDRIYIDEEYRDFMIGALRAEGTIGIYLEERQRPTTNYLFSAECGNFKALYDEIVRPRLQVAEEPVEEDDGVMSYAEYMEAELDALVTVETYVQAKQSWWDNKATVYTQDGDGAYFLYSLPCSEEEYALLVPGTKLRVTGYKSEWAGEIEIVDASFEIVEGDAFIAEPRDVTELLGTDALIECQNQLVAFKGMTVEPYDQTGAAFVYKNPAEKTDDLYFKVSKDGKIYEFCVEYYLCGEETEVYQAVETLMVGAVIDLEGFLYWYEGPNPHIIAVDIAATPPAA